ncbi:MAG: hypothetical protein ABH877_00875 [bacterium]
MCLQPGGRTARLGTERRSFYDPAAIDQAVRARLEVAATGGERSDRTALLQPMETR